LSLKIHADFVTMKGSTNTAATAATAAAVAAVPAGGPIPVWAGGGPAAPPPPTLSDTEYEVPREATVLQAKIEALYRMGYVAHAAHAAGGGGGLVDGAVRDAVCRLVDETRLRTSEGGTCVRYTGGPVHSFLPPPPPPHPCYPPSSSSFYLPVLSTVFADESLTLSAAGIADGAALEIERVEGGGVATEVTVTVQLVRGNDAASAAHNPARPGARGATATVTLRGDAPVRELRDRAGVALLGLPDGWTVPVGLKGSATGPAAAAAGASKDAVKPSVPLGNTPVVVTAPKKKVTGTGTGTGTAVGGNGGAKKPDGTSSSDGECTWDPIRGLVTSATALSASASASASVSSKGAGAGAGDGGGVASEWRLRRTNLHGESGTLLDEAQPPPTTSRSGGGGGGRNAPKAAHAAGGAGEAERPATVASVGLRAGDLVLLEEGPPPRRHRVRVHLYLWVKNTTELTGAAAAPRHPPRPAAVAAAAAAAAAGGGEGDAARAAYESAQRRHWAHLLPLLAGPAAVQLDSGAPVQDLHTAAHAALASPGAAAALAAVWPTWKPPPGADYLLLREIHTGTDLPGQCLWVVDPPGGGGGGGGALASIGIQAGAKGPKPADGKAAQAPLRSKGWVGGGDYHVCVEVLEKKQANVRKANAVRVWVHRLLNPAAAAAPAGAAPGAAPGQGGAFAEMSPAWPPVEVTVVPSLGAINVNFFKQRLWEALMPADAIGGGGGNGGGGGSGGGGGGGKGAVSTNVDRVCLLHFSPQAGAWEEMKAGLQKGRGGGKAESVLDVPYSVKEGDLFCAYEMTAAAAAAAAAPSAAALSLSLRPEDAYLRQLAVRKAAAAAAEPAAAAAGKKRHVSREVALRLGGDLDFGSDDDDDDDVVVVGGGGGGVGDDNGED